MYDVFFIIRQHCSVVCTLYVNYVRWVSIAFGVTQLNNWLLSWLCTKTICYPRIYKKISCSCNFWTLTHIHVKCNSNTIGDEFHYPFVCNFLRRHRLELLAPKFYNNPSMLSFNALLSSQDTQVLGNVCKFIKVIFNEFSH